MFKASVSSGADTSGIELAYRELASEMTRRSLFTKGMPKTPGLPTPPAPATRPAAPPAAVSPAQPPAPPASPPTPANQTPEARQAGAEAGLALPDGSFHIPDEAALHQAIRLVAQAPDPQAAMMHIIERAEAMGLTSALPPSWAAAEGTEDADDGPKPGAHRMTPEPAKGTAGSGSKGSGASSPSKAKKAFTATMADAFTKALDAGLDPSATIDLVSAAALPEFEQFAVTKSAPHRYTMGPVYMPGKYDAHDEWTTADELQKAMWDYVRSTGADRTVFLQHSDKPAGEWVEVMQWPHAVTATMTKSIDGVNKAVSVDFPAGTVYMGTVWKQWAWDDIQNEKITGFSMGGWAKRIEALIDAA